MHQAQSERRQTEPLTPVKEKRSLPERGAANTSSLEKPATAKVSKLEAAVGADVKLGEKPSLDSS